MTRPARLARLARLAAAGSLCLASVAAAQPGPPQEPDEIVVTGEALDEQVRNFVTALTPGAVRGQLGRFERAVCPVAVGLPAAQAQAVASRLRRVAEAARIDVAPSGCWPNIVVVVTDDKRAFLDALRQRQPGYFGGLQRSRIQRLFDTEGPAVAWQTPGPAMNADGVEVAATAPTGGPLDEFAQNRTSGRGAAIAISAPTRLQFGNAVVIVERRALEGLTTIQLADYAAMRTLARADPGRLNEPMPSTILTVLAAPMGGAVPVTITAWDLNFLRGLYATRGDLYAPAQRGEIGSRMREALEPAQGQ